MATTGSHRSTRMSPTTPVSRCVAQLPCPRARSAGHHDLLTSFPQVEEEAEGHNLRMEKVQIRNTLKLHDSALLTWGDGTDGKLGHHTEESLHVPYVITAMQQIPIMSAALGKKHSLFLTEEGMILACGNGQFGQLGLGAIEDVRLTPVLVQGLHSITQVAAGDYHSLALNDQGLVYSWGSGSWGKLGLSYDGNVSAPRVISTLTSSSVKFVACGSHHSACISFSGDVWTWYSRRSLLTAPHAPVRVRRLAER